MLKALEQTFEREYIVTAQDVPKIGNGKEGERTFGKNVVACSVRLSDSSFQRAPCMQTPQRCGDFTVKLAAYTVLHD